jgi:hypothetical protein
MKQAALFLPLQLNLLTVFYSLSVGTGTIAGMAKHFLDSSKPAEKRLK